MAFYAGQPLAGVAEADGNHPELRPRVAMVLLGDPLVLGELGMQTIELAVGLLALDLELAVGVGSEGVNSVVGVFELFGGFGALGLELLGGCFPRASELSLHVPHHGQDESHERYEHADQDG